MRSLSRFYSRAGASLPEALIGISITAFAIGAIYVGSTALQKSFRAARHYSESQSAQLRLIDYIALDLRRATKWPVATNQEIELIIPNYYDSSSPAGRKPRHPKVTQSGEIYYGNDPQDTVKVRYYTMAKTQSGKRLIDIHRSVTANGTTKESVIVSDAEDFELSFDPDDPKRQIVRTKITFPPSFRPFVNSGDIYRDGTATYATTLVRNKR